MLILWLIWVASYVGPQQSASPIPVFQSSVNLVPVDVTVTNGQGRFLTGLGPGDFTVLEEGKPQTFAGLDLESPDAAPPASAA